MSVCAYLLYFGPSPTSFCLLLSQDWPVSNLGCRFGQKNKLEHNQELHFNTASEEGCVMFILLCFGVHLPRFTVSFAIMQDWLDTCGGGGPHTIYFVVHELLCGCGSCAACSIGLPSLLLRVSFVSVNRARILKLWGASFQ